MRLVHASEVDQHRLIHKLTDYFKLKDGEVDHSPRMLTLIEMQEVVALTVHCTSAISLGYANLKHHGFICGCGKLLLWLLEHDFEETSVVRCPLDHVVLIVVNFVNISQVEVTRDKLLVVPYLVQVVREVSVRALLLEWATCLALQVVASMIDLLLAPLIESRKSSIVHVCCKHCA